MIVQIKKWLLFSVGIIILSFGIALTIWAQRLGVSPWEAFHIGLMNIIPLSLGQIIQLVGVLLLFISYRLGVKPKLGTIVNVILIGWGVDIFLDLLPANEQYGFEPITFLVFIGGIALCGLGTGLYITADVGSGPRDSMMIGLNQKFGIRIAVARTALEVTVFIIGFLLGGPIGVGTIIFSFTIGLFVEKSLAIVKRFTAPNALHIDDQAIQKDI